MQEADEEAEFRSRSEVTSAPQLCGVSFGARAQFAGEFVEQADGLATVQDLGGNV